MKHLALALVLVSAAGCSALDRLSGAYWTQATLVVAYAEPVETVRAALERAATTASGVDVLVAERGGFTALSGATPADTLLTVTVTATDSGAVATMQSRQRARGGLIPRSLALDVAWAVEQAGLTGHALPIVRARGPYDECPPPAAWPSAFEPYSDKKLADPEELAKAPTLIGGLARVQERVRYPEAARRAGVAGEVMSRMVVSETGDVTCAEVFLGAPMGLNEAVLDAVVQMRFRPSVHPEAPDTTLFTLPIKFYRR